MSEQRSTGPALSVRHRKSFSERGCLLLFFGIFFVAGIVMLYFLTVRSMWSVYQARDWILTPCTIVSSELGVHGDGDTFSIDITYDYEYEGQQYRGERYDFMHGFNSSGRKEKQAVVDRYRPGQETSCYVDPRNPRQAVLNRDLPLEMLWGLLSLPFLAIGGGGLLFVAGFTGKNSGRVIEYRSRRNHRFRQADEPDTDWSDDSAFEADGPVVLKPRYSPLGRFVGTTCLALFWNGIVSIFVYQVIESFRRGQVEWCLTIFVTPFVLVGLLLVWGVIHSFAALFNPRPTLILDRARLPLGSTARLSWRFAGNPNVIRQLRVTLRGEEHATYRQGTDTHTDKHTFVKQILFESHDPLSIPEGEADVRIPDSTMHSFSAPNNAIHWEIHLDGEIPLRPDVDAEFPITVTPHNRLPYVGSHTDEHHEFVESPSGPLTLHTVDGRTAFEPGEEILVDAAWDLEETPERLELRLVWSTSGKGTTDFDIADTIPVELPSSSGRQQISIQLPHSPYSFSGNLISLVWALELVVLPSEQSARLEITIAPGRQEIQLGTDTGEHA